MKYVVYVKGERGVHSLKGLVSKNLIPVLCVSESEDPELQAISESASIPFVVEKTPKSPEHLKLVAAHKCDLLVCAGYSRILPESLFKNLRYGGINCHGGQLPQYRGASPVPWQIIQGETSGSAYVLRMQAGIDDGPILAQVKYDILPTDTAREVTDKVTDIFKKMVPFVVESFWKGDPPKEIRQSQEGVCHWTRRKPEDGLIRFSVLTVRQAVNMIRGLADPYPGAFFIRNGQKILITRARAYPYLMRGVPGRMVGKSDQGVLILATDGAIEALELKCGGKTIRGIDFDATYGETYTDS